MKTYMKIGLVMVVILGILFAVSPGAALAKKIQVTGKFIPLTSGEPVQKYWETGDLIMHARVEEQGYYIDTDDPLLVGWGFGSLDWEINWYPDGSLRHGHLWGPIYITADESGTEVLWECTSNGFIDELWNFSSEGVCHGVGENKYLQAKFSLGSLFCELDTCYYPLTGRIIDPQSK